MKFKNLFQTLLFTLLLVPSLAFADLDDLTPVSHWTFDESSGAPIDSNVTNSNDLTNNNTTPYVTGIRNNSIDLELSSSQSVTITDASQTNLDLLNDWSISAWVNLESLATNQVIAGKWNPTGDQRSYVIFINASGIVRMYLSYAGTNAGTSKPTFSHTPLTTGSWKHIVVTYEKAAGQTCLYINAGTPDCQTVSTGGAYNSTSDFGFGSSFSDFGYFDGKIDEGTVFDYKLTASNVTTIYNSGTPLAYTDSGPPPDPTSTTSTSTSLDTQNIEFLLIIVIFFMSFFFFAFMFSPFKKT